MLLATNNQAILIIYMIKLIKHINFGYEITLKSEFKVVDVLDEKIKKASEIIFWIYNA